MTANGWLQILLFLVVIFLITKPLGIFMTHVFNREKTFLDPVLRPLEKVLYRVTGVDENHEMRWTEYSISMLLFSGVAMLVLYLFQRLQQFLPWNPQHFAGVGSRFSFQYRGFVHHQHQLAELRGREHDELSHPDGRAGLPQLHLGSYRHSTRHRVCAGHRAPGIENYRQLLGGFHPLRPVGALAGMPDLCADPGVARGRAETSGLMTRRSWSNLNRFPRPGQTARLRPKPSPSKPLRKGPVASQEAIKMLGTNGGGFFNANSAHPFENPTPLSNFLQMLSIFAIPAGLTYTLGRMTASQRHGWAVWAAMAVLFFAGVTTAYWAESRGNPLLKGVDQRASLTQSGGNMEGKEVRFGMANSALFATVTTDASCGAVNSFHDSFTPSAEWSRWLISCSAKPCSEAWARDCTASSSTSCWRYSSQDSWSVARLSISGKKIEAYDVKMAMLVTLVFPLIILVLTGISCSRGIRHVQHQQFRARTA